jgi:hypothetical protein
MNLYQLESKEMDVNFLRGETVKCNAALKDELLKNIKPGDKIVVQLSNRSKYMGVIKSLDFTTRNGMATGSFGISRK